MMYLDIPTIPTIEELEEILGEKKKDKNRREQNNYLDIDDGQENNQRQSCLDAAQRFRKQ